MPADWTSVRIRRTTLERLKAFVAKLERATDQGQYTPAHRHYVTVTTDDAILALLDREERKSERARKSRKGKGKDESRMQPE